MSDQDLYARMSSAALAFAKPNAAQKIAKTLTDIATEHK
jgi:UDP-N-acetylglucosamine:LPS N-acetylglucosamine transferase